MDLALKYLSLRQLKKYDKELQAKQVDLRHSLDFLMSIRQDIMTEMNFRKGNKDA